MTLDYKQDHTVHFREALGRSTRESFDSHRRRDNIRSVGELRPHRRPESNRNVECCRGVGGCLHRQIRLEELEVECRHCLVLSSMMCYRLLDNFHKVPLLPLSFSSCSSDSLEVERLGLLGELV